MEPCDAVLFSKFVDYQDAALRSVAQGRQTALPGLTTPLTVASTGQSLGYRSRSFCVEVDILDGEVPVGVKDFEAALFFLFVGLWVGIELLDK